jgi:hypothetical protein
MMKRLRLASLLLLFLLSSVVLFASPVELVQGSLKLILYPDSGGFSLQRLSPVGKNRFEPLFDDRNSGATTFFSVQANGRVFKLAKKIGKPIAFEQNGLTARYVYTLTDDFQVTQDFSFADSGSGSAYGLRIDTSIENTSGKTGTFALKALLDTSLGESQGIHFTTDARNRVSSEAAIDPANDTDAYIRSADEEQSLVIPLGPPIATKVEAAYIGNWDRLNTLSWKPESIPGRSFNTVYSINDSAVLLVWPGEELEANGSLSVSIVLGPDSSEFLAAIRPHSASVIAQKPSTASSSALQNTAAEAERNGKISEILERIEAIQKNPDSATDRELEELNATLDALLNQGKD